MILSLAVAAVAQEAPDPSKPRSVQSDQQINDDLHVTGKLTTGGNVGVGTTDPQNPLHVFRATDGTTLRLTRASRTNVQQYQDLSFFDGALEDSRIRVEAFTGGNHGFAFWSYYSGALREVMRLSNGNVGIGTPTPGAKLHVSGTFPTYQRFSATDATANNKHMEFQFSSVAWGDFAIVALNDDGSLKGNRFHIDPSGNVGVGTTAPQKRLHVAGDIQVDGNINAKFQDIAEWVPATESLDPGTVVVIAPQNHVAASTDAYDTRVAGVVSPRPGLTLGEAGESKVLVATTGRVKVRVDASNGAIREGDILVSSAMKGVAMKSEPLILSGRKFHQPGTVIGKALQPLEKGSGEILVLLSMQ